MGLFTVGGALTSVAISFDDEDDLVKALKGKDASEVGLCVYKDKDVGDDKGIWEQINPCVWGEEIVEDNGCLVGWGIVIFIILIIFFGGRRRLW